MRPMSCRPKPWWPCDGAILSPPKVPARLGSTACQANPCPKPDWARPNCTKDALTTHDQPSTKPWWITQTIRTSPAPEQNWLNGKAIPKTRGNGSSLCVNTKIRAFVPKPLGPRCRRGMQRLPRPEQSRCCETPRSPPSCTEERPSFALVLWKPKTNWIWHGTRMWPPTELAHDPSIQMPTTNTSTRSSPLSLPGPMKTKTHWRKTWSSLWVHPARDPACWNAFSTPTPMLKDSVKFHWEANCFSIFPPMVKSHGSAEPTT